jgi:hypothetical protein
MISNMQARRRLRERIEIGDDEFIELVIWEVPVPVRGSLHGFKYRLAYVRGGVCLVRFDNEAGKGDHQHIGDRELPYVFSDLDELVADFRKAVSAWRGK